jgi:hypothetical protein
MEGIGLRRQGHYKFTTMQRIKIPDDKDKLIIKLLIKRVPYKQMTSIVSLSIPGINKRIKVLKDHYTLHSITELIEHFQDNDLL